MEYLKKRIQKGEILLGIGSSLGSSIVAEIIGSSGFDWIWIDLEHGIGGTEEMIVQLQAIERLPIASIVRVPWNETYLFKRVLDSGASGVMVPFVSDIDQAKTAVQAFRYPPQGTRGVAKFTRAAKFGTEFNEYFKSANSNLSLVVQIENSVAVANADAIASVDGVDVLFVGPLDLSVGMGIPQEYDHPKFVQAIKDVAEACKRHGKAAGILVPGLSRINDYIKIGYTFFVVGSDGGLIVSGLDNLRRTCKDLTNGVSHDKQ